MVDVTRNIFLLAAAASLFAVAACTDAAEPVSVTKTQTATPQQTANSSGSREVAHSDEGQDAPRISLEEAKKAFDEKSATFIDTHVKATYDAGHIPGAINVTVQDLEAKFNTIPKGKKIIAYCS
jgi:3-mercaptopyruvate sulfurtransferase SseA